MKINEMGEGITDESPFLYYNIDQYYINSFANSLGKTVHNRNLIFAVLTPLVGQGS